MLKFFWPIFKKHFDIFSKIFSYSENFFYHLWNIKGWIWGMECGLREVSAIWKAPLLNSCICLLRYFSWFWNIFVPGRDLGRAGGICRAKSAIWDAPKLQFVRNKQSQESCVLQLTFLYLCICTFVFVIWDASELQFVGNQQSQECSITHQGGLGLGMNPFIVKFNWRQDFPFVL